MKSSNLVDAIDISLVFHKPFHSKSASIQAGMMQRSAPILLQILHM